MSESKITAQEIMKYIAAYDKDGQSSAEIDTQKEFKLLGEYLNGRKSILNFEDGGFGASKNTDLNEKETNILLETINSLKEKFGSWEYIFDKKNTDNCRKCL